MIRRTRVVWWALAGAAALGVAGCSARPGGAMPRQRAGEGVSWPFAAAAIEIHPLTRVEVDRAGERLVVCHIEVRDAWGDPVKSTGKLEVQLYRAVGLRAAGLGTQELTWDVDLSDLEMQRLFDAATRTYRLELEGAPEWLLAGEPGRAEPMGRLRAVLTTTGPGGEPRTLTSEMGIGGQG